MMLTDSEKDRYSRQLLLAQIGEKGQLKLKAAKVLVAGAGGLGCPVLTYLAAAGVGKIGIADQDIVELSNLQRQVLYDTNDVGKSKVTSVIEKLKALNPGIEYQGYVELLSVTNALRIIDDYEMVIDCTDTFPARYIINDACVLLKKPFIFGGISDFNAQVSVFNYENNGPTYRCAFPIAPKPGTYKTCAENGVIGVLPGIIGNIQATEAIKIITGIGDVLSGEILVVDLLNMNFEKFAIERNEDLWNGIPHTLDDFEKMNYEVMCGLEVDSSALLTIEEVQRILINDPGVLFADVRIPAEKPVAPFMNVIQTPLGEIRNFLPVFNKYQRVIFFCASGKRSGEAVKIMKGNGHGKFYSLWGGLTEWLKQEGINR